MYPIGKQKIQVSDSLGLSKGSIKSRRIYTLVIRWKEKNQEKGMPARAV
ncbi:hypothetical protein P886_1690 [Alteromonadaceae bacterium 2753L.S.0a.02]|nr:hypothetical protein P886_1690 [Alteromonadaceae bacterium 2753L.S.0a.02]